MRAPSLESTPPTHVVVVVVQLQCIPWDVARHLQSVYQRRPSSSFSPELSGLHPERAFDAQLAPFKLLPADEGLSMTERMRQGAQRVIMSRIAVHT